MNDFASDLTENGIRILGPSGEGDTIIIRRALGLVGLMKNVILLLEQGGNSSSELFAKLSAVGPVKEGGMSTTLEVLVAMGLVKKVRPSSRKKGSLPTQFLLTDAGQKLRELMGDPLIDVLKGIVPRDFLVLELIRAKPMDNVEIAKCLWWAYPRTGALDTILNGLVTSGLAVQSVDKIYAASADAATFLALCQDLAKSMKAEIQTRRHPIN